MIDDHDRSGGSPCGISTDRADEIRGGLARAVAIDKPCLRRFGCRRELLRDS